MTRLHEQSPAHEERVTALPTLRATKIRLTAALYKEKLINLKMFILEKKLFSKMQPAGRRKVFLTPNSGPSQQWGGDMGQPVLTGC